MKEDIQNKISSYQDNVYPGYSDLSNEESIYSLLYHASLSKSLNKKEMLNEIALKLNNKLDKNGFLKPELSSIQGSHSIEYVSLHMTSIYYCLFGSNEYIQKYINENIDEIEKKWNSLDYSNAWSVSNELMAWATLVSMNKNSNSIAINKLQNFLLTHDSFDGGIWQSKSLRYRGIINSLAATFHYLPFFTYNNIRIPNCENYISYIKKVDLNNGFFSSPMGYACIDYDLAYIAFYYVKFNLGNILENDKQYLKNLLIKSRSKIIKLQNNDGGFPEYGYPEKISSSLFNASLCFFKNKCIHSYLWNIKKIHENNYKKNKIIYSNSSKFCGSGLHESNIFSSWFRLLNIEIINSTLELIDNEKDFQIDRKNSLPGIGYNPIII